MAIPYNTPSLAELLAAYKNNGAGDAINSLSQGVQSGMGIAAQRQQAQLTQQNKLAELSNQQTTAQAAQASAAAEAQKAQAAQQEAAAKTVPADQAEKALQLPPGTLGAPGQLIPASVVTDINNRRSAETVAESNRQATQANLQQRLAEIQADTQMRSQQMQRDAEMNASQRAQTTANTNLTNASHQVESLPWYTSALATVGLKTPSYKVAQQNYQHSLDQAGAANQPVFGQTAAQTTPAANSGTVRIKASDGSMHDLPSSNLTAAKQRDPGLQVIQ